MDGQRLSYTLIHQKTYQQSPSSGGFGPPPFINTTSYATNEPELATSHVLQLNSDWAGGFSTELRGNYRKTSTIPSSLGTAGFSQFTGVHGRHQCRRHQRLLQRHAARVLRRRAVQPGRRRGAEGIRPRAGGPLRHRRPCAEGAGLVEQAGYRQCVRAELAGPVLLRFAGLAASGQRRPVRLAVRHQRQPAVARGELQLRPVHSRPAGQLEHPAHAEPHLRRAHGSLPDERQAAGEFILRGRATPASIPASPTPTTSMATISSSRA